MGLSEERALVDWYIQVIVTGSHFSSLHLTGWNAGYTHGIRGNSQSQPRDCTLSVSSSGSVSSLKPANRYVASLTHFGIHVCHQWRGCCIKEAPKGNASIHNSKCLSYESGVTLDQTWKVICHQFNDSLERHATKAPMTSTQGSLDWTLSLHCGMNSFVLIVNVLRCISLRSYSFIAWLCPIAFSNHSLSSLLMHGRGRWLMNLLL